MGRRNVLSRLLLVAPAVVLMGTSAGVAQETVTLRMILVAPEDRWNFLLDAAQEKFAEDHPDVELSLDVQILPFADRLTQLRAAAIAGTPLDIVSLDQPEVGDFAAAGFTTDLTARIDQDLDGLSDWLPAYREATRFQGGWHAIWAWTDARVMWFWKDLAEAAGIDPETDLATWQSYLDGCQKLDEALSGQDTMGCLLIGQPWIADWTYPYVWMNQGALGFEVNAALAKEQGAAEAWVPSLASAAWIEALQFTRDQVDAGIEPFTEHQFGTEFVNRSFAVSLDGTWVLGALKGAGADLGNVGMVGAFPVPSADTTTATMAGGWALAIPRTSENPDVAWDFLKAMLDISTLGRVQTEFGYLPTRASFAAELEQEFASFWNEGGVDRWSKLQDLAPHAYGRPSFPSWPQVGAAITDMVQNVMFADKAPEAAAEDAQRTVLVDVLGWPAETAVEVHDDAGGSCEHDDVDRPVSAITPVQRAADADGSGRFCSHVVLP
ncbi:MAG: extracellular solute-binding protein [Geminicoccaceae bacterium]